MAFIDGQKYRKLVEAMNNGDDKAKAILMAQYHEDEGLDGLLNDYFAPKPAMGPAKGPKPEMDKKQKFLDDNGVKEGDPDYDEIVAEFESENPDYSENPLMKVVKGIDSLIADELEAVKGYQEQILVITGSNLTDTVKTGVLAKYNEIINEELHHIEELKTIKSNIEKVLEKN